MRNCGNVSKVLPLAFADFARQRLVLNFTATTNRNFGRFAVADAAFFAVDFGGGQWTSMVAG